MYNLPRGFDVYQVNVKTMRKIAQIFVAFFMEDGGVDTTVIESWQHKMG